MEYFLIEHSTSNEPARLAVAEDIDLAIKQALRFARDSEQDLDFVILHQVSSSEDNMVQIRQLASVIMGIDADDPYPILVHQGHKHHLASNGFVIKEVL